MEFTVRMTQLKTTKGTVVYSADSDKIQTLYIQKTAWPGQKFYPEFITITVQEEYEQV